MKKLVAGALILFTVFMSYVFIGGFLQKQQKESQVSTSNSADTTSTQSDTTTSQSSSSTSQNTTAYTATQVSDHSSTKDCWLIINSKVYNVTSFLREHPGGASTIIPYCGKEATKAFDTQDRGSRGGHSSQASQMLADYLLGTLSTN